MKISILLIFFSLHYFQISAQSTQPEEPFIRCLTLQMTGKQRNVNFYEGDNIKIKLHSDHKKNTFQIIKLTDSSFFYSPYQEQTSIFDLQELKFRDIKKIYLGGSRNPLGMKGFGALGGAGVMLSSFDILNKLIRGATIKIDPTIVGVSIGLVGTSYLIKVLTNPIYRINKRHYFRLYHLPKEKSLLK